MKRLTLLALVSLSLVMIACKPTTQLPVKSGQLEASVGVDVDKMVCTVRAVAAEQRLSFHYRTFTDQGGPKATIMLAGNLFELELAKWAARSPYELRAYVMSRDASARQSAEQAFDRFKTSFARRIEQNCAT